MRKFLKENEIKFRKLLKYYLINSTNNTFLPKSVH